MSFCLAAYVSAADGSGLVVLVVRFVGVVLLWVGGLW